MNPIHALLAEVQRTGQLPDDDMIAVVVTRGSSARGKHAARTTIRRSAQKIINALDCGLPDQAAQLAEAVGEELAGFTGDGSGTSNPRELAAAVPRSGRTSASQMPPKPNRAAANELAELFGSRLRDRITAADLDRLATRAGATAEQVGKWREDVLAADREVRGVYRDGQQALARRLISEHATNLAGMLAAPEQHDPNEAITDPRELAGLVPRDRSNR